MRYAFGSKVHLPKIFQNISWDLPIVCLGV